MAIKQILITATMVAMVFAAFATTELTLPASASIERTYNTALWCPHEYSFTFPVTCA